MALHLISAGKGPGHVGDVVCMVEPGPVVQPWREPDRQGRAHTRARRVPRRAPGEVLALLPTIRDGDGESWCRAWSGLAAATQTRADGADTVSRGHAGLRASNYHRAAEFFLPVDDPRRLQAYRRAVAAFRQGLATSVCSTR